MIKLNACLIQYLHLEVKREDQLVSAQTILIGKAVMPDGMKTRKMQPGIKKAQKIENNCGKIWRNQKKVVILQSQTGNNPQAKLKVDSVAQLVEQMTLNHWVVGSSPTGVTSAPKSLISALF